MNSHYRYDYQMRQKTLRRIMKNKSIMQWLGEFVAAAVMLFAFWSFAWLLWIAYGA